MIIGIILAAGKGKRFKAKGFNKTVSYFAGKPLVRYSSDLFLKVAEYIFVVVGVGAKGVIEAVGNNPKIIFVKQRKRLGTGHATKVAVEEIQKKNLNPKYVLVGYGDHMMFYTKKIIKKLIKILDKSKAVLSIVTCEYKFPNLLAWGRIIRDKFGNFKAIVEQKDATGKQKQIKELNAGLYCFRWEFLRSALKKLKKSSASGEYYLTDLVKTAVDEGKFVVGLKVPFEYVGIGVNTKEELLESERLYLKRKKAKQ